MMQRRPVIIAVSVVVGIGLVAVFFLRSIAPETDAPPMPTPAVDAAEASAPTTAASSAGSDESAPPWATSSADALAVEGNESAMAPKRAQQMAQLEQTMGALVNDALSRSVASREHLLKALDTLEEMDDPTVNAQINLDALRHNLEVSSQMQTLVQELQQLVAQPESPERRQRIDALKLQFEALRSQLRTDVTPPGAPLPLPAPDSVRP